MSQFNQPFFPTPAFSKAQPGWPLSDAALERYSIRRNWLRALTLGALVLVPLFTPTLFSIHLDGSMIFGLITWTCVTSYGICIYANRVVGPELTYLRRMPASSAHELDEMMEAVHDVREFVQAIVKVRRLRVGDLAEARKIAGRHARAALIEENQAVLDRIERSGGNRAS